MNLFAKDFARHPALLEAVKREGHVHSTFIEIDDKIFYGLLQEYQPSLSKKVKHYIASRLRIAKSKSKNSKVSGKTQDQRLRICEACIFSYEGKCLHNDCGCNIPPKTLLSTEKCPIGRW